ncbi:hypothetical protein [Micromonospora sp. NPDC004704]
MRGPRGEWPHTDTCLGQARAAANPDLPQVQDNLAPAGAALHAACADHAGPLADLDDILGPQPTHRLVTLRTF